MKQLSEFLPLLAFLIAYWQYDLIIATAVLVGVISLQVAYRLIRYRRLDGKFAITAGLIIVLGGVTLYLDDPLFIMWKPTVVCLGMAALLMGSELFGKHNAMQYLMGGMVEIPKADWRVLNLLWAGTFTLCALLNLWVMYSFSEAVWVNFKVFGLTAINLVAAVISGIWMMRRSQPEGAS
ncbi:MAG: septation protein IspZ [Gammaproteobacteria bacterium AqS3]|nr:septation protein IspZ [Gammaproteobacteria bacterium AqS3]